MCLPVEERCFYQTNCYDQYQPEAAMTPSVSTRSFNNQMNVKQQANVTHSVSARS